MQSLDLVRKERVPRLREHPARADVLLDAVRVPERGLVPGVPPGWARASPSYPPPPRLGAPGRVSRPRRARSSRRTPDRRRGVIPRGLTSPAGAKTVAPAARSTAVSSGAPGRGFGDGQGQGGGAGRGGRPAGYLRAPTAACCTAVPVGRAWAAHAGDVDREAA